MNKNLKRIGAIICLIATVILALIVIESSGVILNIAELGGLLALVLMYSLVLAILVATFLNYLLWWRIWKLN